MSSLQNSALWACISFLLAGLAFLNSFAIAHDELLILLVFNLPAIVSLSVITTGYTTTATATADLAISLLMQYICYLALIHGGKKVFNYFKNK